MRLTPSEQSLKIVRKESPPAVSAIGETDSDLRTALMNPDTAQAVNHPSRITPPHDLATAGG